MTKLFSGSTFVAAVFLLLAGCKKNEDAPPAGDYSPISAGSTWTYQTNTTPGAGTGTYTLTATNRDSVVNGRSYRVFTSTTGTNSYRNKSGNDYWSFGTVPAVNLQIEQLYLKDNAAVGANWQSTQTINMPGAPAPLVATLIFTVKEKGISRTVSGTSFSNVIRVGLKVSVTLAGEVVDADFYHAPGVGLIETRYEVKNLTIAGIPNSITTEVLTAHSIK